VQEKLAKFCGYGILDSAGGLGGGDTLGEFLGCRSVDRAALDCTEANWFWFVESADDGLAFNLTECRLFFSERCYDVTWSGNLRFVRWDERTIS
jgi:hypothetical protein